MKTLIKLTVSLVCIFLFIQAGAQITPPNLYNSTDIKSGTNISTVGSSTGQGESSGASYERVEENLGEECSMYLNKNWSKGKIVLNDNTIIIDRLLRYNLYNQQMELTSTTFVLEEKVQAVDKLSRWEEVHYCLRHS